MTKANSRNTNLAYVTEVTPGVTPATPAFKLIRLTDESLNVDRQFVFSNELNGKRGQKSMSLVGRSGSGGTNGELSYATYDDWLESLFRGTWATDVLIDGDTPKTFTLEVKNETGATDIYKRHLGAQAESATLAFKARDTSKISFEFSSLDSDFSNAALAGATYTASNTNPIMNGADWASLTMAGLTIGCVDALSLTFKNNLSPIACLGSLPLTDQVSGGLEVTGSMSIILSDDEYDVLRAYADGTATSLMVTVGRDAGSKYKIELPNLALEDTKIAANSGDNGSMMISASIRALQSATLSGQVARLTRAI